MITSDVDEGSFKKSRSLLLAFSSLVLILWYFKAELSTISVLGNSVRFTANIEHVWLLLAMVNAYLLLRFVQHLPDGWQQQGAKVEKYFESMLIHLLRITRARENYQVARADLERTSVNVEISKVKVCPEGQMAYRSYDPQSGTVAGTKGEHEVIFSLPLSWLADGVEFSGTGTTNKVKPGLALILICRVMSFAKGMLLAPWFTEYIFPLLFASVAATVAMSRWLA